MFQFFPPERFFEKKSKILNIHGIAKSNRIKLRRNTHIAIEWDNGKQSSVPIEVANLIARGRRYDGKDPFSDDTLEELTCTIDSLVKHVSNRSAGQHIFSTNRGLIRIQDFELARTFFFHNQHLTRAAFRANGLGEIAYVEGSHQQHILFFPPSTKYPVSNLSSIASRKHLAWIFIDQAARKSFFSIYTYFIEAHKNRELGFMFDAPDITGWHLKLLGRLGDDGVFDVYEIDSVRTHLKNRVGNVEFDHPKFKEKAPSDKKSIKQGNGEMPPVDIDPELDMGEVPSMGGRIDKKRQKGFSFNVDNIGTTTLKKDTKKKSKTSVKPAKDEAPEKELSSVGLPESEGTAQEFDPVINQDETYDLEDVPETQKFLVFRQLMNELSREERYPLDELKCCLFPVPTNKSKAIYETKDGLRLRFFIAKFSFKKANIILIEADTDSSTKDKKASTLILGFDAEPERSLFEIVQSFSNKGGSWDTAYIQSRTSHFERCNHLSKMKDGENVSESDYLSEWKKLLKKKLDKLNQDDETV
ncbi:Tn7-like element transposition protein TnsE [Marinomonas alcarazii]|uniref:Tn7-like element transposition protein TnsE n=1 Tax=Marinomonas alcarazii TaxID=491949 RepID=UPI000DA25BEF|nr:Tn7-like element transposition protein TnsE [Marinomonas alcarazii]